MLENKTFLITAGPTWEAIDPVRGITNHSSGKMGYALATTAAKLGARVLLVSGPVCLPEPTDIETTQVQSALQMYDAVHAHIKAHSIDVFIGVAAVADYRPVDVAEQKIKKSADKLSIELTKNPDIVASVAALTKRRPFTVGFAAETQHLQAHAKAKLKAKKLDMIIANDVSEQGVGFGADDNRVLIISAAEVLDIGRQAKSQLAETILSHIHNQLI